MDYQELQHAYQAMCKSMDAGSKDVERVRDDLYRAAARYAELRVHWRLAPIGQREDIDSERTRAHNSFIACCNALSRAMHRLGFSTEWRKLIGDEETVDGRKRVGDFACFLSFVLSLEAR